MTAAPRTPQPSTPARVPHKESAAAMIAQLVAMFRDDEGWIEAWHGHADPSTPASIILDTDRDAKAQRWHWYTRERRPELVRLLLDWSTRYGNVYISTTLYSRPDRAAAWALPSRVLFADDAPEHAPLPYSMVVETSAGKRQACYLLHTPVDAATRYDLQRRIAYALHADKSGADVQQLCRVAGTWNTKRSAQHPVTLTYADGPRYSLEQLQDQYPPVAHTAAGDVGALASDEIAHWLGNIGQLLGADGIPRRLVNPNGQTRRVLAGEIHMPSTSDDRACVCRGLVMHGYPDAEIAALLIHFCDYSAMTRKGSAWLYDDIARLIAKERARQPHVTPTPSGAPRTHAPAVLLEVPRKSRARQDRPQRVTDDEYLAWCLATMDGGRQVKMTRREIAAAHGVSVPTADRIEARLRARGALERFTSADRRRSWLAVYAPPMMIVPGLEVDAAAADDAPEVLSGPRRNIERAYVGKEHTPPVAPAAPSPDPEPQAAAATFPALADAMREAFTAVDGARITRQRIAGYLEANYPGAPWGDAALCYWYGVEMQRRQRERSREKLLADLPSMPHAKLRRLERRCDRLLQDGPDGPHGQQYYFAQWAAPLVADELASDRRRAAMERTKVRRGRRPAPPLLALVDVPQDAPSAADAVEPSWMAGTLMDVPEIRPAATPAPAPIAAVCSPTPPAGPTAPTVEARAPTPAAAAARSQPIVRPDLYARLAAQRSAAAVPV